MIATSSQSAASPIVSSSPASQSCTFLRSRVIRISFQTMVRVFLWSTPMSEGWDVCAVLPVALLPQPLYQSTPARAPSISQRDRADWPHAASATETETPHRFLHTFATYRLSPSQVQWVWEARGSPWWLLAALTESALWELMAVPGTAILAVIQVERGIMHRTPRRVLPLPLAGGLRCWLEHRILR